MEGKVRMCFRKISLPKAMSPLNIAACWPTSLILSVRPSTIFLISCVASIVATSFSSLSTANSTVSRTDEILILSLSTWTRIFTVAILLTLAPVSTDKTTLESLLHIFTFLCCLSSFAFSLHNSSRSRTCSSYTASYWVKNSPSKGSPWP